MQSLLSSVAIELRAEKKNHLVHCRWCRNNKNHKKLHIDYDWSLLMIQKIESIFEFLPHLHQCNMHFFTKHSVTTIINNNMILLGICHINKMLVFGFWFKIIDHLILRTPKCYTKKKKPLAKRADKHSQITYTLLPCKCCTFKIL